MSEHQVFTLHEKTFSLPLNATFNGFLTTYFRDLVGEDWYKSSIESNSKQPIAVLARAAISYTRNIAQNQLAQTGAEYAQCGAQRELYTLANDLSTLELLNSLPESILKRIKRKDYYQGARYEVAVAASLCRAGFNIQWLDEEKAPEFIAQHSTTGESFVVEAKSRHRDNLFSGKLNRSSIRSLKADVKRLYQRALSKNTNGFPYAIFIDAQIPYRYNSGSALMEIEGLKSSFERISIPSELNPAREFFLGVSSHGWYFNPSRAAPPIKQVALTPLHVERGPRNFNTVMALIQAWNQMYAIPQSNDSRIPVDAELGNHFERIHNEE